ncbi:polyribonucleotide nucleotidyltransferase 1, mitochondrial [Prorops nasuta]|uniref:polyribonucleotide nucleotidyltransferase 1, mitochondrial n=1 Tax=Prorops nasuta TaxID=863751 RepID=UPI0034CFCC08
MVIFNSFKFVLWNKQILLRNKIYGKHKKHFNLRYSTATESAEQVITLSNGKVLKLSTGKFAKFASGSSVVSLGDTSVMVTAVSKDGASQSSFLPLIVDYRQKAAAGGRIPTNFLRRELAPTEHEILTSRCIDRSVRPLFPEHYSLETQIICNILAVDGIHDPDVLSITGASAALSLSNIPWHGPVAAIRVGLKRDEILLYPTRKEIEDSLLNLIVTATKNNLVVMLEGSASNVQQQTLMKAIKLGTKECQNIIRAIEKLKLQFGKDKKQIEPLSDEFPAMVDRINSLGRSKLKEIFSNYFHDKVSRDNAVASIRNDIMEKLKEEDTNADMKLVNDAFNKVTKDTFRKLIFDTNKRCDGRSLTDIRNINCETNIFKPLHGSAMFQRGQTQVFCTVTLDSLERTLTLDPAAMMVSGLKEKNFFLHYEFPPYATNETGRTGHANRREIGHGALAERGLRPVVPKDYPFTIRLTSEVFESNGSSSMASVCGGSMALMDAGVPTSGSVAGVAIGLITDTLTDQGEIENYRILTDILGIEDYLGDMDMKLAATKHGITALQADIKVPGLSLKIIMESIQQAWNAKNRILLKMHETIDKPRTDKESLLPVTCNIDVPRHLRSHFIGPGGMNIKKLASQTGVHVFEKDESIFSVFAPNQQAMDEAKEIINELLKKRVDPELEFGGVYKAKIVEIRDIGVMVTFYENMTPALLHLSQLDHRKIQHPSALGLEVGHELVIKYFGRDPASGQMRLSRKVLQEPVSTVKNFFNTNTNSSLQSIE